MDQLLNSVVQSTNYIFIFSYVCTLSHFEVAFSLKPTGSNTPLARYTDHFGQNRRWRHCDD